MPKEHNKAIQNRLEEYLNSGISQNKAALAIGVSASALSQYRQGKYIGDIDVLEAKISEFFANAEAARELFSETSYVDTGISKGVYQTIRLCHLHGGLAVEAGDAGVGKTMAAKKYIEDYPNTAIYIAVNPCTSSVSAFLKSFAKALHIDFSGRKDDMWSRINDTLLGSRKVLIIDESQHLPIKTIETIRSFTDSNPDFGVCLIGNLNSLCNNGKPGYAQIRNRTRFTSIRHVSQITIDDIKLLFPSVDQNAAEFLYKIAHTEQALRGACNLYRNAADNGNITYAGLKAMAEVTRIAT